MNKKPPDPIRDAVAAWLCQKYQDRLRKSQPAAGWHQDAGGLLAEIKRAAKTQESKQTEPEEPYRLTLGELLRIQEEIDSLE